MASRSRQRLTCVCGVFLRFIQDKACFIGVIRRDPAWLAAGLAFIQEKALNLPACRWFGSVRRSAALCACACG
jgi:hypothetical protein